MDRLDPGRGEHEADEHGAGHGSGEAEAAEAFEALRAEVAGLGRGLERLDALVRRGQREQAEAREDAPDYSPTLGAMAKELAEARERLAAIEVKPALKLTPSGFQAELKTAVGAAALASGVELQAATRRAEALAGELKGLVEGARERGEQRVWLWSVGLSGALAGAALWIVAAGVLPRGAGHWLAALLVGGSRWEAGAQLIHAVDPVAWERVVRLNRACGEASTELCEAALVLRRAQAAGGAAAAEAAKAVAAPAATGSEPPPAPPQPAGPRGRGPQGR